jgi:hypothetical protein
VEPDRFDDVEFRVLEEPDPPRPPHIARRRRRRVVMAAALSVTAAGCLAAGASALTGPDEQSTRTVPVGAPKKGITYNADGVPMFRSGHECHAGKGGDSRKRRDAGSADGPRY